MGWHLRPLSRCNICDKPATQQLYNALNAPGRVYCGRHGPAALKGAQQEYEERQA